MRIPAVVLCFLSCVATEGRTVEAVYYPDEGHVLVKRENQRDELTRSVAWRQKYLRIAQ